MKMGMYRRVFLLALKMNLILWDSFIFCHTKILLIFPLAADAQVHLCLWLNK
jgi:hypothetical protein